MYTETIIFESIARRLDAGTYTPHRAAPMPVYAPRTGTIRRAIARALGILAGASIVAAALVAVAP